MKKKPCALIITSVILIYLAAVAFSMSTRELDAIPHVIDSQIITIDEGVLVDGEQRTSVAMPAFFDVNGETRLQFTLNYSFSGRTVPSLILQANHSFMTVLLDGEQLFHVEPTPHSLGNYFIRVLLPQTASNAQLEIRIAVPESGLNRIGMSKPIIANESVFLKQQLIRDTPSLLLNTLIMLCGIMLIVLAVIGRKRIDFSRMLLRGFLALNCALYFMCETYSVVLLAPVARTVYIFDMVSFAILCPPLLALLGWELEDWRRKMLNIVAGLGMAGAAVQLAISFFSGIELRRLLPMTHAMQIVGILAIIVCFVYGLIFKKSNRSLYFGGVLALGGAIDLVFFIFEFGENNVYFMKIALLSYLFSQMYQFVNQLMKRSADEVRESYYKALALQDPLSNCFSRAAFELDKNSWNGETVRTSFFLDLNNLKTTNDLYGHGAGDQLIRAFGDILNRVFFSVGKCYRVGGDEFWVFCDGLASGQATDMVCAAKRATDIYNKSADLPIKLSYAIGVCDTAETNGDLNLAIELADSRMYEDKRSLKQGRNV